MKKLLAMLAVIFVVISGSVSEASADEGMINYSNDNSYFFSLSNVSSGDERYVIIQRPSGDKQVMMKVEGQASYFLPFGSGDYKILVAKKSDGDFIVEDAFDAVVRQQPSLEDYLKASFMVNWSNDSKYMSLSNKAVSKAKNASDKAKAAGSFLLSSLSYDARKLDELSSLYVPNVDDVLQSKRAICLDFAVMFAASLRENGVPAQVVVGYKNDIKGLHAWNKYYDEQSKKWVVVDVSYDKVKKSKAIQNKSESQYSALYSY